MEATGGTSDDADPDDRTAAASPGSRAVPEGGSDSAETATSPTPGSVRR
jgi:hypothetical protein